MSCGREWEALKARSRSWNRHLPDQVVSVVVAVRAQGREGEVRTVTRPEPRGDTEAGSTPQVRQEGEGGHDA